MKHKGMTLVELLVAMLIGLGITLAITSLLIASENHKRSTTSTNDAQQSGMYAYYALDKVVRGAGSAIASTALPSDIGVLGCHLNSGSALFPRAAAFPAPFTNFLGGATNTLTVAPVLIGPNQSDGGSDVLMVMGGSGAAGGVPRQITGGGSTNTATLDNTVGFSTTLPSNDVVLVSQNGQPECLLEQVSAVATPTLTLGGVYYTAGGGAWSMATLAASTQSYVTPIGNATANNIQWLLYGVDASRTLWSYDLLQNQRLIVGSGGDVSQTVADDVVQMNALYGIDTVGNGTQGAWAGPSDAGWDPTSVMLSSGKMRQIVSVRIALVVRGEYYDKNNGNVVSPTSLTLFNGLTNSGGTSLAKVVPIVGTDQQYRYRVFEFTVPLRNMILIAGGP